MQPPTPLFLDLNTSNLKRTPQCDAYQVRRVSDPQDLGNPVSQLSRVLADELDPVKQVFVGRRLETDVDAVRDAFEEVVFAVLARRTVATTPLKSRIGGMRTGDVLVSLKSYSF